MGFLSGAGAQPARQPIRGLAAKGTHHDNTSVVSTTSVLPDYQTAKREVPERTCMHDCCVAPIRTRFEELAIKR